MKIKVGNLTTNQKVKVYFFLLYFGMIKIVTWEWHVYDSAESGYDMILGEDLLTALESNLKL